MPNTMNIKGIYEIAINTVGEKIKIRRYTGVEETTRTYFDYEVHGVITTQLNPINLSDFITEQESSIIVSYNAIVSCGIKMPIKIDDKIVIRGREHDIISIDQYSRSYHGEIAALTLRIRG